MKLPQRKLTNWLAALEELTGNTETPAHFWMWSGLFTLNSAMQRKVWLDYGFEKVLPNLYIFLIATPGKCRKAAAISLAKKMLVEIKCNVGVDSSTKPSFTQELSRCTGIEQMPDGEFMTHSSMSLISKELSSLMIDLRNMVDCLTDIYDYHHPTWEYKTKGAGKDEIYGPCVGVFAATTPSWMANNLPYEAIGDGFASRIVMVTGDTKRTRVPRPVLTAEQDALYRDIVHDLGIVNLLKGGFEWSAEAKRVFDAWYERIDTHYESIEDERFHGFLERMHVIVLKVCMALRVSYSNSLVFTGDDMSSAISLVEDVLPTLPEAFGPLGRSTQAPDVQRIMDQFKKRKKMTKEELYRRNWRHCSDRAIAEVLATLIGMGFIKQRPMKSSGELAGMEVYAILEEE